MYESRRFYYYLIFGAAGGATGWFFGGLLAPLALQQEGGARDLFPYLVFGGAFGAAVGLAIAAYDGLSSRSLKRFLMLGVLGTGLGAVAGCVALPLAQALYAYLMKTGTADASLNAAKTVLCWTLFGGMVGFVEGIRKGTQSWKGFLGGVVGGAIGGTVYHAATTSSWAHDNPVMEQVSLAAGLAALGGSISASVVFITTALRQAFVEILNGKRQGEKDDVTKHVVPRKGSNIKPGLIGSDDWSANIYLPGDSGVMPHHAQISFVNGEPTLTVLPEALKHSSTLVNRKRVTVCALKDGDRLQVGSTYLIYRQKRR